MKSFVSPTVTFTPGVSGVGTVDLSDIESFDIRRLVAIINQTDGVVIYATGLPAKKYTDVTAAVVSLFYDTSAMDAGDVLQVIYEDLGARETAKSSPVAFSTEQENMFSNIQQYLLDMLNLYGAGPQVASSSLSVVMATEQEAILEEQKDALNLLNVSVGAMADAEAPGIGTYSLISLIKLVGSRILAMSIKLPGSLGTKTMANSLSITLASDQSVLTASDSVAGSVSSIKATVGTSAVRATVAGTAPSAARKKLIIKPSKNNTGAVFIGGSGVTTSNGLEFIGPDRMEFEFDSADYYLISDTAAQVVEILEKV
jgi:hypothetical protein